MTTTLTPVPQIVRVRDRYDDIMDALPLTPRQERARITVRAMLITVEYYVDSGDIDRFTTADVARRCRISIGTVYRYFDDRVALLDALYPDRHAASHRLAAVETYLERTLSNLDPKYPWSATDQFEFIDGALSILRGNA
jgi:AcrR family transcriptional regulator